VIVMDADLQDPPEEIRRFIEKWKEGWDVVFALRARRKEGIFKRFCYKAFYRLLSALSHVNIPLDAGDFCLMDRRVVNILAAMPERNRFIRGLRSWVGFRQTGIPYDRPGRAAGTVKYTYGKLIKLAIDGIVAFTSIPLRLATLTGFAASVIALVSATFFLLTRIFPTFFSELGFPLVPGFASTIIAVFFWAEFNSYALES
jgi:polyisoprenyl-phosphate glycosyltransferase